MDVPASSCCLRLFVLKLAAVEVELANLIADLVYNNTGLRILKAAAAQSMHFAPDYMKKALSGPFLPHAYGDAYHWHLRHQIETRLYRKYSGTLISCHALSTMVYMREMLATKKGIVELWNQGNN